MHPDFEETDRLPGTFFKILSKVAFFIFGGKSFWWNLSRSGAASSGRVLLNVLDRVLLDVFEPITGPSVPPVRTITFGARNKKSTGIFPEYEHEYEYE